MEDMAAVHDWAGAFKLYLRESPEPLVPYAYRDQFISAGSMWHPSSPSPSSFHSDWFSLQGLIDEKERADALKEALKLLPEENKQMMEHLFEFLSEGTLTT